MQQVRCDRLTSWAEQLRQALDEEVPGRERQWTKAVQAILYDVKEAFQDHSAAAEASDGPLATMNRESPATLPTVNRRISGLRWEHIELLEHIVALEKYVQDALEAFESRATVESASDHLPAPRRDGAIPDFGLIRGRGLKLLVALERHEEAESLLVLDTVNTDIGVGD
jgi:hypothetical protein